jgi:hypothetical protein
MGGSTYTVMLQIESLVSGSGFVSWALTAGVSGLIGLAVYLGLCALLRVRELSLVRISIARVLRGDRA